MKKIEFHNTCPKCKRTMQRVDKANEKSLFYYCKKCKQKYRVYTSYKSQIIDCPHCNKQIKMTKNIVDKLYMNLLFNYDVKKSKCESIKR